MRLPEGVRRLLRLGDGRRDVADEVHFHLEQTVAELRRGGMTEAEARCEAARRFGDVADYRRQLEGIDRGVAQAARRTQRLEAARDVAGHALRSVLRSPALSVAVVVTLGLGLGANVAVFGILDRLLLSAPGHVREPEQLHRVFVETWQEHVSERRARGVLSYPEFSDMLAAPALAGGAVWSEQRLTAGHGMDARLLNAVAVSGAYFDVIGARPALGRFLTPADDDAGSDRAAVLGYAHWQSEYGGAADVLGRTIDAGSASYTIVGVAPPGMVSLRLSAVDVWLPVRHAVAATTLEARNYLMFAGVVRRRADVSATQAAEQMTALLRRANVAAGETDTGAAEASVIVAPLLEARGPLARPETNVVKWATGVALIVLLIACVNVANLLLMRTVRQSRELAVRMALGVSRRRLVSQTMLEGLLLGLAGGAAALLIAHWAGLAAGRTLLPDVAWAEVGWTRRVLWLALLAAVATGLLAALAPALHALRPGAGEALRGAGSGAAVRTTSRLRAGLALAQAALSVVLLVGAGLFVRSLDAALATDLGYDMRDVLLVDLRFAPGATTPAERAAVRADVLERLQSHAAVADVALAGTPPFSGIMMDRIRLPGRDSLPGPRYQIVQMVAGDYFGLLRIRPLQGRTLTAEDARRGARVLVVNETMARALWPDGDVIGACVYGRDPECMHVVGVVPDTRHQGLREQGTLQYYLPLPTAEYGTFLVRPRNGVRGAGTAIRSAALAADPRIRMVEIAPAEDRLQPQVRSWRLGASLFTAFGLLALLVSAVGLYAVIGFDVSQRTREIGVRSALGASRSAILRLVLVRALVVAGAGIGLGTLAAALLAPRLRDLLFGVGPRDPLTYGIVAATLITVAVLAALLPARRAAAVDPNVALRAD